MSKLDPRFVDLADYEPPEPGEVREVIQLTASQSELSKIQATDRYTQMVNYLYFANDIVEMPVKTRSKKMTEKKVMSHEYWLKPLLPMHTAGFSVGQATKVLFNARMLDTQRRCENKVRYLIELQLIEVRRASPKPGAKAIYCLSATALALVTTSPIERIQ